MCSLLTAIVLSENWRHAFPFFLLPVAWLSISAHLSVVSGWQRLARQFRAAQPFTGSKRHFRYGQMRFGVHYNGCLTVGADMKGLRLSIFFPFRFFHPPLFIPWSEIAVKGEAQGLVFKRRRLLLGNDALIPLVLSTTLADKLLKERDTGGQGWGSQQG